MTWGDEEQVRKRFVAAGIKPQAIEFDRATWMFRQPGSAVGSARDLPLLLRAHHDYGAAEQDGRADRLHDELLALFEAQNSGGASTAIPATYLKVTVTKD